MRLVLATALLLAPAPVLASVAPDAASSATESAAPAAKEKKVCKLESGGTTSRMRRRVCRTVKEWSDAENGRSNAGVTEHLDLTAKPRGN